MLHWLAKPVTKAPTAPLMDPLPTNGWFEWIVDPGRPEAEAALLITAANDEPLFFAALVEVYDGLEPDDHDGFVIITAAADQGMVDIHDASHSP